MKPTYELADVIRHTQNYIGKNLANSARTLSALAKCRTAALGGHIDRCTDEACGHVKVSYNSCRNRHCPKCQQVQKENWLLAMQHRTLPVPYFHVVFTVPHELNCLAISHPKLLYDTLFKIAWDTLKGFAAANQYQIKMGMTAVLHTWGQNLSLHPHLHCIVPAGGLDAGNKWKTLKGNLANGRKGFLFPMEPLKLVYKSKFMAALRKLIKNELIPKQSKEFMESLFHKEWVIYAKRPFAGPNQVIEYLGRYTHKVAISNHRLLNVTAQTTTFTYKDYKDGSKKKNMELYNEEFIRRFSQHILPEGFTKIRHFGLHAGACTKLMDEIFHQLCNIQRPAFKSSTAYLQTKEKNKLHSHECPACGQASMVSIFNWQSGKPPPTQQINQILASKQH